MNDVKKAFMMKRSMPKYLAELNKLVGREVHKDELLSLAETDSIRESIKQTERIPSNKFEINFEDRKSSQFQSFIDRLHRSCPAQGYIWIELAYTCGYMKPIFLSEINFGFDFDLDTNGIVEFITSDFKNKLSFDWYEEGGRELIEIESSGAIWSAIAY